MDSNQPKPIEQQCEEGIKSFSANDLDQLLQQEKKIQKRAKRLGGFFQDFQLLWQMLKDYKTGHYTTVPWKLIAATGFAIVYLLNPFDLVPDVIPLLGVSDDLSMLALVLSTFKKEIQNYRLWREQNTSSQTE